MNEIDRFTKELLLRCMCCGSGIRDCVEIADVDPGTVLRYLRYFGIALAAMHDQKVKGLRATRLEIDEVWSLVGGKSRNRRDFSPNTPRWFGDYFTWTALDPDTKLLVGWHVSKRKLREALLFLHNVRQRVVGRLMITTDALPVYKRAISVTFGADADHVRIEKVLQSRWNRETGDRQVTVVSMTKVAQNSRKIDINLASTSHNERHNATIRNFMGRMQRYTYGFSKKLENHLFAHAIYAAYYNFRKPHRTLGHLTPAMAAGVADHVWSFADLLDEIEEYWRKQAAGGATPEPPTNEDGSPLVQMEQGVSDPSFSFFVWHDPRGNTAKVHAGHCHACRFGRGKKGGSSLTRWFTFHDRASAESAARTLAPDENSVCSICIKHQYRTKLQPV